MDAASRRKTLWWKAGLGVLAAVVMLAGSYALVGRDQWAFGDWHAGRKASSEQDRVGTVVERVKNTAQLDDGLAVISVPLKVGWRIPGRFYGDRAKAPIGLGPKDVPGTTQDPFGARAGVLSPDGTRLLYHFWQELVPFPTYEPGEAVVPDGTHMATPTIRVLDTASGEDTLVRTGARSMAWRSDGMFAYAQGVDADYRLNVPYLQRVMVQLGLDGSSQLWTSDADRYTVVAWAGQHLLVWREVLGGSRELLAFDGPDSYRTVVHEGEWNTFLAVSPQGDRLLLASDFAGAETGPLLRVVEWPSGREVASLSLSDVLDPLTGEPIGAVREAAWEGDRIVVTLGSANVAVLSAPDDTLVLDDIITFKYPKLGRGPVNEPMLDASGSILYVVADEGANPAAELERTAVLAYDLASGACTRWTVPGASEITRMAFNASRPR